MSHICVMQEQEKSEAYKCKDYMSLTNVLGPSDRAALCDWGYRVIEACKGISRLTAVKAFSYFDRFLSLSAQSASAQCALQDIGVSQLAFVASLVIALKVHSGFNVEPDFVSDVLCNHMYNAKDINNMEMEILQALEWRVNGPTPHDFIDSFLEIAPLIKAPHRDFLTRVSKFIVELAVVRYPIALHQPSEIAFASICCALQTLEAVTFTSIDSVSVLHYLQMVSGLSFDDPALKHLFNTMVCLNQEFHLSFRMLQMHLNQMRRIRFQARPLQTASCMLHEAFDW
jgi:hypothetical protein